MPSQPDSEEVLAQHAAINLHELLNEVLAIDLEEDYPQTPEEVMRLFGDTFRLLYGWDRNDRYTISRVLEVQRGLYAQAMLDLNPFTQQLATLLALLDVQYEMGLQIIGISIGSPVFHRFSPDDRCVVTMIKFANSGQSFQYSHQLFRHPESGRWQIGSWSQNE